jgi:hypothetical protein
MTWRNACGFFLMGLGMFWLPVLVPEMVAAHTVTGSSAREVWLLFMGALNASLGAGALGWPLMTQVWHGIPAWVSPVNEEPEELEADRAGQEA